MRKKMAALLVVALILTATPFASMTSSEANEDTGSYTGETIERKGEGFYGKVTFYDVSPSNQNRYIGSVGNSLTSTNEKMERFGEILNAEMDAYLKGMDSNVTVGPADSSSTSLLYQLKSTITFDFTDYMGEFEYTAALGSRMLDMIYNAIGKYPNLATLFTSIGIGTTSYSGKTYVATVSIDSPIDASEIISTTQKYKEKLAELEYVPKHDTTMTEEEKILYIHDQIVTESQYSKNEDINHAIVHTAIGTLLNHDSVCQGYAVAFAHAVNDLGFDCEYVTSTGHAWNAIKLDDLWYHLDTTWDDPVIGYATESDPYLDYVDHDFFLTDYTGITAQDTNGNAGMHTPNFTEHSELKTNTGNAYDTYYPKAKDIETQLSYLNESWYYCENGRIYIWDGESDNASVMEDVADAICCDVYNGTLYYANAQGVFRYVQDGDDVCIKEANVTNMVIMSNEITYVTTQGANDDIIELTPIDVSDEVVGPDISVTPTPQVSDTPTVSSTPEVSLNPESSQTPAVSLAPAVSSTPVGSNSPEVSNTPEDSPTPSVTPDSGGGVIPDATPVPVPTTSPDLTDQMKKDVTDTQKVAVGKVKLSSVKKGKKKLIVSYKKSGNVKGIQITYSTSKKFKAGTKSKLTTSGKKYTISKLKSKKKYYIKIRAYALNANGKKIYGKYSAVKVCKTK